MTEEEISNKVIAILKESYREDWHYNGEDEVSTETFDEEYAKEKIMELIQEILKSINK